VELSAAPSSSTAQATRRVRQTLLRWVVHACADLDTDGQVASNDGGSPTRPSTMLRPVHTANDQADTHARGVFSFGRSEQTSTARRCVPVALLCRDAGAMLPFGGIAPNGGLGLS